MTEQTSPAQSRENDFGTSKQAATILTMTDITTQIETVPGSLHAKIIQQLDDDQAQDIVSIPLEGKSSIADHMVIASGRSTRQVAAMAQKLAESLKKKGEPAPHIEGLPAADWVLVDAGDVVVHLFRPEVRSFYNLERMWGFNEDGKRAMGSA